jgi:FAD:protein FMN transferase
LKTCRQYHESTGGAFDIALGPLQDFGRQPVENRREEDLAQARAASGMHNVVLDEARQTIQFAHPLARIDLGGFGKGFALEQLQPVLADAGVRNALISFGESSILALGHHPHGDCWKLGIRDIHTGQSVHVFEVNDGAISTSGLKHFNRDGHSSFEGHIVEAGTGSLIERPLTVAVKSASPLEAEVLSTALIAAAEKAGSILQNFPACEAVGIEYDSDKRARVKHYEA